MINSKYFNKIVFALIFLSLFICVLIVYFAHINPNTKVLEYEEKLFGDEILSINIQVDGEDWQGLLDSPTAKEYIPADLTINGETFGSVGLRTKGNSSLSQVAQMKDSDRYSIHFKFNKYKKGQTYYGLDSFCINNLTGDNSYMKDYISYNIMNFIDVPAPLMNYANVSVNGENFGFYIALERYEKSFLNRVYNTSGGEIYNVKIQMGQREDFVGGNERQKEGGAREPRAGAIEGPNNAGFPPGGFNQDIVEHNKQDIPDNESEPAGDKKENIPEDNNEQNLRLQNRPAQRDQNQGGEFPGGRGGGPGGQNGGSLVYVDDNISSYSSIFDNAEFKKNSDKDKQRVITAIKYLNEGRDLEKYFDVDEILRYLAAHTVVVNLDSYSSSIAQNYYIYERDGKISILPWDYNLAFGGFQGGDASNTINFPIDTPVSGVSMEDRPLISKLLEVPEYKEKYHEYLREIVDGYFYSGIFEESIKSLDAKINDYVKNDTTSFTSYEQYTASLPLLIELGTLRAQSIEGQLNGSIASTTEGQDSNKNSLISGEGINLSALGSFMGGRGNHKHEGPERMAAQGEQSGGGGFGNPGEMPDRALMQDAMSILQENGGQINDEAHEILSALGLSEEQIQQITEIFNLPSDNGFGAPDNRWNRNSFPGPNAAERQYQDSRQGSRINAGSSEPAYLILIAILLLIVIITTYLLSRFNKRY